MGAGISKQAANARIRRALQRFARENGGTYAKLRAEGVTDGLKWSKGINVIRASNGEAFGSDVIVIHEADDPTTARAFGFPDLETAILAFRLERADDLNGLREGAPGDYKRLIGRRNPFIQTWGFRYCIGLNLDDGGFDLFRPDGTMLPFRGEGADFWARELWLLLPRIYRRWDSRAPLYRTEAIAQANALDAWAEQFADEDWIMAGGDWRAKPDSYKGDHNLPFGDPR